LGDGSDDWLGSGLAIRVSSIDQRVERQFEGVALDRIFTDKASGKDVRRPELETMVGFVREGDTVIVHSMDRLARNLDGLRGIAHKLTAKGVEVHFVKEQLSFTGEDNAMGTLLLSVMGAFAEFERSGTPSSGPDRDTRRRLSGMRDGRVSGSCSGMPYIAGDPVVPVYYHTLHGHPQEAFDLNATRSRRRHRGGGGCCRNDLQRLACRDRPTGVHHPGRAGSRRRLRKKGGRIQRPGAGRC